MQSLIASPGLGKTTLLNALLAKLPRARVDSAFVFNSIWDPSDLLGFLLREFGASSAGSDLLLRREALAKFVLDSARAGRTTVAVIDEAQNLTLDALAELRSSLSRTPESFRIILAGQPELKKVLEGFETGQCVTLVTAAHQLTVLEVPDIARYIAHRLYVAGYRGTELFSTDALALISDESKGVPRRINMICSHSLEHGAAQRKSKINALDIQEVMTARGCWLVTDETSPIRPNQRPEGRVIIHAESFSLEKNDASSLQMVADALRCWLSSNSGIWAGTAGELYNELMQVTSNSLNLYVASARELSSTIQTRAEELHTLGIEIALRRRPGQLDWFQVRKGANAPAAKDAHLTIC